MNSHEPSVQQQARRARARLSATGEQNCRHCGQAQLRVTPQQGIGTLIDCLNEACAVSYTVF
ncbi:hypothetical protein AB0O47_39725 [Streptomyces noursei]|uniref:hypothetical protein n=1 Tax=Streptomyces noursei TaxID=1971 RepID=UPI00344B666D